MYTCLQVINRVVEKRFINLLEKNVIVKLYHTIHIEIKYFLRQRTLKTVSLLGR